MSRRSAAAASNPPIDIHTTVQMPNTPATEKKADEKPDFWTYMHSLTPEEWRNHIVYLTRENPKTSINGIGGYLTKLQQPFDIEDIKTAYGGYEFSFIMKNGNDLAYSGRFRVEAPPKYDAVRENPNAVGAPSGGSSAMSGDVLKVLEQQNERLYQVLTTLQGAKEENPAISGAIEMLTSAYKTGLSAVSTGSGAGGDPAKQLEQTLALAERIVSVRGGGGGGDVMTTLLAPLLKTMMEKMLTPPDPLEQITKLGAVLDVLEKFRGGGGESHPKDWKASLVQEGVRHIPDLLQAFREGNAGTVEAARLRAIESQNRARTAEVLEAQRRGAPPPATQPITAPTPGAAPRPVAARSAPTVSGDFETESLSANVEVAVEAAAPEIEQEQRRQEFKVQIVNMIRMGASGETIADFLYDVNEEFCKDLCKYTPEMITAFFAKDPILKLAVEDPRWQEVLIEAHDYIVETEAETANEARPA